MKKSISKKIISIVLCGVMGVGINSSLAYADMKSTDIPTTKEELEEWMKNLEIYQKEYEEWCKIPVYDRITENVAKNYDNGRLIEDNGVKLIMDGNMLMQVYTKEPVAELRLPEIVEEIDREAFYVTDFKENAKIYIPASVKKIGNGIVEYAENVESFEVSEDNNYFCEVDGVLFTKDMTELVAYPAMKEVFSYKIPDNVEVLRSCCFGTNINNLNRLYLGSGIKELGLDSFSSALNSSIKQITIPSTCVEISEGLLNNLAFKKVKVVSNSDNIIKNYAKINGLNVMVNDSDKALKGDVNLDGEVTLEDAQIALKAALNIETLTEEEENAAKVNGEDDIDIQSANSVLQVALGIK